MDTQLVTLKDVDENGNEYIVAPRTKAKGITDDEGTNLQGLITDLKAGNINTNYFGGESPDHYVTQDDISGNIMFCAIRTAGWYRIGEISPILSCPGFNLIIKKSYNEHKAFYAKIGYREFNDFDYSYNNRFHVLEVNSSIEEDRQFTIDVMNLKVRLTKDTTNNKLYVEFYYGVNKFNNFIFELEYPAGVTASGQKFTLYKSPIVTTETVEGVTNYPTINIIHSNTEILRKISLYGKVHTSDYRKSVIALCRAKTSTITDIVNSYSSGTLTIHRHNGLYDADIMLDIYFSAQNEGAINHYICQKRLVSPADTLKITPCIFTYNRTVYAGIETVYAPHSYFVDFVGVGNFNIFGVDYYDTKNNVVLNEEITNSISYDMGYVYGYGSYVNYANPAYPFIRNINIINTEPTAGAESPYPNGTITFVRG